MNFEDNKTNDAKGKTVAIKMTKIVNYYIYNLVKKIHTNNSYFLYE